METLNNEQMVEIEGGDGFGGGVGVAVLLMLICL